MAKWTVIPAAQPACFEKFPAGAAAHTAGYDHEFSSFRIQEQFSASSPLFIANRSSGGVVWEASSGMRWCS